MVKAIWNEQIIAESNNTIILEGNHYFPKKDIKQEFFTKTNHHTTCPWKGEASYYTITVKGKENKNAAWYYPSPSDDAKQIKDHIAFWNGITIEE